MAHGVRSLVLDALFLSQFGAEMRLEALVVFVGSFFVPVFGSEEKRGRERKERTLLRRCSGLFFNTGLGLCVFGLGSCFYGLFLAAVCILE
jgi:peptidoglycan biosynthesis protein MviN/MurJ (putative lipid II flippase)